MENLVTQFLSGIFLLCLDENSCMLACWTIPVFRRLKQVKIWHTNQFKYIKIKAEFNFICKIMAWIWDGRMFASPVEAAGLPMLRPYTERLRPHKSGSSHTRAAPAIQSGSGHTRAAPTSHEQLQPHRAVPAPGGPARLQFTASLIPAAIDDGVSLSYPERWQVVPRRM